MKFLGTSFAGACVLGCMAAPAAQAQDNRSELSKFDLAKAKSSSGPIDVNSRVTLSTTILKPDKRSSLSIELGKANLKPEDAPPRFLIPPLVQDLGGNAQMKVKWMKLKFGFKF